MEDADQRVAVGLQFNVFSWYTIQSWMEKTAEAKYLWAATVPLYVNKVVWNIARIHMHTGQVQAGDGR